MSLAVAVTPSSSVSQPELQIQLGAFDISSTSKPGDYNSILHDNYHRVNLVGLQMQISKGSRTAMTNENDIDAQGITEEGQSAKFFMKLQTNLQIKNEPVALKEALSIPKGLTLLLSSSSLLLILPILLFSCSQALSLHALA